MPLLAQKHSLAERVRTFNLPKLSGSDRASVKFEAKGIPFFSFSSAMLASALLVAAVGAKSRGESFECDTRKQLDAILLLGSEKSACLLLLLLLLSGPISNCPSVDKRALDRIDCGDRRRERSRRRPEVSSRPHDTPDR